MAFIARKKNVEYRIDESEISRFLASGCTIFKTDENGGFSVYKAPAGKEDLQNKVRELEATISGLRNQLTLKDSQIISLTTDNNKYKVENQRLIAENQQLAADLAAAAPKKTGAGKKG